MATPRTARPGMLLDPGAPINSGLVGWWPMWEGAGGKVMDITADGRHGTLTNGPVWSGGGVKFDGSDDYIGAAAVTELQGSSTFTIMLEVAASAFTSNKGALAIRNGTAATTLWILYPYDSVNGNGPSIYYNGGIVIDVNSGYPDANGKFNTFLFRSNSATNYELFVNGLSLASNTVSKSMSSTLSDTTIGTWYPGSGQNFSGWVRNVRIWNRPLTNPEINALTLNPAKGLWVPDIKQYYIPAAGGNYGRLINPSGMAGGGGYLIGGGLAA